MSGLSLGAHLKQINMFVLYFPRIELGVKLFLRPVTNGKITRDEETPHNALLSLSNEFSVGASYINFVLRCNKYSQKNGNKYSNSNTDLLMFEKFVYPSILILMLLTIIA